MEKEAPIYNKLSAQPKRGRPPKKQPTSIADFLQSFEKDKNEYLNMHNRYLILRSVAASLVQGVEKKSKLVGLEKTGLGERGKQFLGEGYRVGCTDKLDPGQSFVVDFGHNPPRIRVKLADGGWKDLHLRLKCPSCGEPLAIEDGELFCPGACISGWAIEAVKECLTKNGIAVV
jgi:hypothetical protein